MRHQAAQSAGPAVHEDGSLCAVYESINILQEKWVLHIVRGLLDGPRGFNELSRAVGGVNPSTLAGRLERLEALGVVDKTVHSTMPPRTSYRLTEAGLELQAVIEAIECWGQRHLASLLARDPA